jgi:hypothetical protein
MLPAKGKAVNLPLTFTIPGNHSDPKGNPVPYTRTTRRAKRVERSAIRYYQWKQYVQKCAMAGGFPFGRLEHDGTYRLDVHCRFLPGNHGDCENVRKGIQDALFFDERLKYKSDKLGGGDKHVWGLVTFEHVSASEGPGVVVKVTDDLPPKA